MKYLSIALVLLLCACYGRKPDKTGREGQPMPDLTFLALDSMTQRSTKEIPSGATTMLISFEPWCPYCKAQTQELVEEMKKFKDVKIYMISTSAGYLVKEFNSRYKLTQYPNVELLLDSNKSLQHYFNDGRIPFTAVYGPDKKLRRAFVGKSSVKLIADVTHEN